MSDKLFSELNLNEDVLKSIEAMGFTTPSKIQAEVIPVLMDGYDAIGQAQTGTGKTLAFGAPMISMIEHGSKEPKSLILTPTRELAIQIHDELLRIAKFSNLKIAVVYGGQEIEKQISKLKKGVDIVVGTPGRVMDLMRRKALRIKNIEFLVLDEADEMLNMGFIEDIEEILKHTSDDKQTMLFSATMPKRIKDIAVKYMKDDAKHVQIIEKSKTAVTVEQFYYETKPKNKLETLCRVLDASSINSAIVFCRTKRNVDDLVFELSDTGYNAEPMHGDLTQNQRINTLRKFKEGKLSYLIATDVAARGIDVDNISHIINYDLPQDTESYIHRIGRTGRANKTGVAITLVTPREVYEIKRIEKETKGKIEKKPIPTNKEIFEGKSQMILSSIDLNPQGKEFDAFKGYISHLSKDELITLAASMMTTKYKDTLAFDYSKDLESEGKKNSGLMRIFLTCGTMDNVKAPDIIKFLVDNSNCNKNEIGHIDVKRKFTFVDVSEKAYKQIIKTCNNKKIKNRKVQIEVSSGR